MTFKVIKMIFEEIWQKKLSTSTDIFTVFTTAKQCSGTEPKNLQRHVHVNAKTC